MTKKQKIFCDVYAIEFNFKEACLVAGVTATYADKCLKDPECLKYLSDINDRASQRLGLSKQYVLSKLKTIVERCMQAEPIMTYDNISKEYIPTGEYTFNSQSAVKALDLLAKHLDISENPFDIVNGSQRAMQEAPLNNKVVVVDDIPKSVDLISLKNMVLEDSEEEDI